MSAAKSKTYLVFVYGSLRLGFHNHALLETSGYLGDFTTSPSYTMYDMGEFPAVAEGGSTAIYGEVYKVSGDVLALLDKLEGHPEWYCRSLITTDYGDSYIYLIQENPELSTEIKGGIWAVYPA